MYFDDVRARAGIEGIDLSVYKIREQSLPGDEQETHRKRNVLSLRDPWLDFTDLFHGNSNFVHAVIKQTPDPGEFGASGDDHFGICGVVKVVLELQQALVLILPLPFSFLTLVRCVELIASRLRLHASNLAFDSSISSNLHTCDYPSSSTELVILQDAPVAGTPTSRMPPSPFPLRGGLL